MFNPNASSTDPTVNGAGLRIGIVQARFNETLTNTLAQHCLEALASMVVPQQQIRHVTVPGALEIPGAIALAHNVAAQDDVQPLLDPQGRLTFFEALAKEFGADEKRLAKAMEAFAGQGDAAAASELHFAAEPRRQELLRRLNRAPGGTSAAAIHELESGRLRTVLSEAVWAASAEACMKM